MCDNEHSILALLRAGNWLGLVALCKKRPLKMAGNPVVLQKAL